MDERDEILEVKTEENQETAEELTSVQEIQREQDARWVAYRAR